MIEECPDQQHLLSLLIAQNSLKDGKFTVFDLKIRPKWETKDWDLVDRIQASMLGEKTKTNWTLNKIIRLWEFLAISIHNFIAGPVLIVSYPKTTPRVEIFQLRVLVKKIKTVNISIYQFEWKDFSKGGAFSALSDYQDCDTRK